MGNVFELKSESLLYEKCLVNRPFYVPIYEVCTNELAALFQKAAVVVCPYIEATQSGVVLTAYAFDKPVIATNTGGLSEYVKHNQTGLLVPTGDHKKLAETIVRIITDTQLQADFRAGIHKLSVEDLNWDTIAKETVLVYNKTSDPASASMKTTSTNECHPWQNS
ncbi:MAG: glycosyltransferase [Deltaproteobacteria bacterium]|nr:glycosyltransferase [Deltaproteobacteria bacterium]